MEDVDEIVGTNTQLKTLKQLEILPTLLSTLRSWNLDQLCPPNPIPSLGECTSVDRSLEAPNLRKKGRMWNLNPIHIERLFGAILQPKPHLILVGTKIPTNLFSQLH